MKTENNKVLTESVRTVVGAKQAAVDAISRRREYRSVSVDASGGLKSPQRMWGGAEPIIEEDL